MDNTKPETRRGLFTKLGIFGAIAVVMVSYGKYRANEYKQGRHLKQSDAVVNSQLEEFNDDYYYPGKPTESNNFVRKNKYEGAGNSYSSRRPGDRLGMFSFFDRKG